MQFSTPRKIWILLHAHKFKMAGMCDERKWINMNEKILFKCFIFLHKYMIAPTTMQLGSLEPVYDIYW
jgi:hypothetical protein